MGGGGVGDFKCDFGNKGNDEIQCDYFTQQVIYTQ